MFQLVFKEFLWLICPVWLLFSRHFSRLSIYRNAPRGPPEMSMPIELSAYLNLIGGEFHTKTNRRTVMFSKKPAIFGGLVFFAIGLAAVLVSAQQYYCNATAVTSCGPNFGSTDCNSLLCVSATPAGTPHALCYPNFLGTACNGFTCRGTCSDTGAACQFTFTYRCP